MARVLVVDDDAGSIDVLGLALGEAGHDVIRIPCAATIVARATTRRVQGVTAPPA